LCRFTHGYKIGWRRGRHQLALHPPVVKNGPSRLRAGYLFWSLPWSRQDKPSLEALRAR
jgi:hypothetical protein